MPRGRLNETTVQKAAVDWLLDYYVKTQPDICAITTEQEARVKKGDKLGWGRADGLVAAELADGSIITASLEAKSSRTFRNISPHYRDGTWLFHAFLLGIIVLATTAILGWTYSDHWFWNWIFPLLIFSVSVFAFIIATYDNKYYRPIDVIDQVKRYPANEQWIALSTDAFNTLSEDRQRSLMRDIDNGGIGFIRVSSGSNVFLEKPAKYKKTPKGYNDLLCCYAKDNDIRFRLKTKWENLMEEEYE